MPNAPQITSRWYQNRWPWIIIAMLGGTIALCINLLVVAIKTQDPLVVDNYYDAGKGINRSLEREQLARDLGLRAEVLFDELTGEAQVLLNLISPTRAERDLHIALHPAMQPGLYLGQLPHAVSGRLFIELLGNHQGGEQRWRLFEEEQVEVGKKLLLGDEPLAGATDSAP